MPGCLRLICPLQIFFTDRPERHAGAISTGSASYPELCPALLAMRACGAIFKFLDKSDLAAQKYVHQGMQQSILLVQWHLIHSSESETQH